MCHRMGILYYTEKFKHYLLISWQVKLLLDFFQLLIQLQEILYIYIHLKSYIVSNTLKTIFWSKFEALLACHHKIYTLERIFLIHRTYNRMGIRYFTIFHFWKNLFLTFHTYKRMGIIYKKVKHYLLTSWQVKVLLDWCFSDFFQFLVQLQEIIAFIYHILSR